MILLWNVFQALLIAHEAWPLAAAVFLKYFLQIKLLDSAAVIEISSFFFLAGLKDKKKENWWERVKYNFSGMYIEALMGAQSF